MKKAVIKYLPFILSFLLGCTSYSFAQSFITRLYTTADGLSDNYIFSVYQDSYGYLWIGTINGLNRFDGKKFVNFGIQQGLPSMEVVAIYEDGHHRLWIGTKAGVAELRGDSCYTYPVNDHQNIGYVSGFLEPDPSRLWVSTNKGLYELHDHLWIKKKLDPDHTNDAISRIIVTKQGLLVNYNNDQLLQLNTNGKPTILLSKPIGKPYYNSLHSINDGIYISTYSSLLQWKENKWQPLFKDTLSKKYIFSSYHDKHNRWWFATKEDGILVAIPNGDKVNWMHIHLPVNLVSDFFEDRDGNIWAACFQGLLKLSPAPYQIVSLPALNSITFIRNCIFLPPDKILVSGDNGRLVILKNSPASPQLVAIKQLKTTADFIDFHTFDEKQKLWFTTREGRLYTLENSVLKDVTYLVRFKNEVFRDIAYNKKTKQLFVCGDSVLLIGNETRLDTFFNKKKQFIPFPSNILIRQSDGATLVQTLRDGLFFLSVNGNVQALGKEIDLSRSFIRNDKDKKQTIIWVAYPGKGISKYSWEKDQAPELIETVGEKNGLSNYNIADIIEDKRGKVWTATADEITVLEKKSANNWIHQRFNFDHSDNSFPLTFTHFAIDNNSCLWMSGSNRLFVFDTKQTAITSATTNTVIEKIILYNSSANRVSLADSVENYRRQPVNPILQYNQNTLNIIFKGLQYSSNSSLEYSYRLLPSGTAWSNPAPGNEVSFYQLNPGKYIFQVRSHLKGFGWSEPAIFSFIIKKPFWETWWFRMIVVLIASALIIFIFQYRLRQLKQKTEMQHQILEMEMKALKAQMNPHFIHNALNSIQSLVINNRNSEAGMYISKFAKLLRQVLENADKNLISLDRELYSLQLYVDLEKLRMDIEIDYAVQLDENIDATETKILPLTLQPFVENALWHGLSRKEGDKKICVCISAIDDWLHCEITDNGVGRKNAEPSVETFPEGNLSKAVHIIRRRLIDFNQSPSTEPITFIDLKENEEPAGTTVIVRIKNLFTN